VRVAYFNYEKSWSTIDNNNTTRKMRAKLQSKCRKRMSYYVRVAKDTVHSQL